MRFLFFFFKQKTAYEMRISDWSSDVCSSDLRSVHQCIIIGRRFVERDALLIEHMLNFNPALEPLALGLQPREQAQRRNAWSGPHACELRVDIVCKTITNNGIAATVQERCQQLPLQHNTPCFHYHVPKKNKT